MSTTYTEHYNFGKQENYADLFSMKVITDNWDSLDAILYGFSTGKQDKLSATNKLSVAFVDFTPAQIAALGSGITDDDVEQIDLNKNNISSVQSQANWNTNNGVKNLLSFDADTMKSINTGGTWSGNTWSIGNNVTLTINSDKSVTLNGTANAGKTIYLTKNLGMAENAYTLSTGALTTKLWAGIIEVGGTENNYTGATTHIDKTCQPNHITIYIENGCTLSNLTIYPMLTLKSLYDADRTYQPYALSNVELTAKEQVNENNILLITPTVLKDQTTSIGTDYTLVESLTQTTTSGKLCRISAALAYSNYRPRGIVLSYSNDSSDFDTGDKLISKNETAGNTYELSASAIITRNNVPVYVWAKAEIAREERIYSIMEQLGDL